MKRLLVSSCLFLLCLTLSALGGEEEPVPIDGIYYEYNGALGAKTVSVIGCINENVAIPSKITLKNGDYEVVEIKCLNCPDLKVLSIPSSVSDIEVGAFSKCTSLQSINVSEDNPKYTSVDGILFKKDKSMLICYPSNKESSSYSVPESVTYIDWEAFSYCKGIKSLVIPHSVKYIGFGAFQYCTGLENIFCYMELPSDEHLSDVEYAFGIGFEKSETVLHTYDTAIDFYINNVPGFKDYVVFEKVTDFNITYYVDNEMYKTVQYKYDDVITPEPYSFKEGYTLLEWKDLPANMPGKDIEVHGVFTKNEIKEDCVVYWAKNEYAVVTGNDNATGEINILSSVEFNNKQMPVTEIGDNSFKERSDITKINIPASVTKIGERSFANIDHLTDVTIYAKNVPETDRTAFENSYIEDYVTLHVPAGSVDKYKAVAPWKNFKSVVPIEGTKEIPAPEIVFEKGEVTFTCEEEGVTFHYEVTPLGQDAGKADKITLGQSYKIKVYASKEGCQDSEIVTKEVSIKKGDLNLDGKVDVADHVELTNIILNAGEEEKE